MPKITADAASLDVETNSIQAIQVWVQTFCEERDWDQFHGPKDLAIGLVTESAELLDLFRFKSECECSEIVQDPARRERVQDELADILFFLLRFSQLNKIDLIEALRSKIAKNAARYPLESSRGSNRKYNDVGQL